MMSTPIGERVAGLEARSHDMLRRMGDFEEGQQQIIEELRAINNQLQQTSARQRIVGHVIDAAKMVIAACLGAWATTHLATTLPPGSH